MTKPIEHSTRAHAVLSASGASKWMNCTPSARLEQNFPESRSRYADEGTLAHEIAELRLRRTLGLIETEDYQAAIVQALSSELYYDFMFEDTDLYVDYVLEQFKAAKARTADATMEIEKRVDLTAFIEDGYGTCDDVIIADGTMEVIDLKFGKGVRVSAVENAQLMLYGLGALYAYEIMYDIHTVKLTIVQPRLDTVSSWEISADELRKWAAEQVVPKAALAYAGEGEAVPGTHCRWCKAKTHCKALAEQNLAAAKADFTDPKLLTTEELVPYYEKMPLVQDWLNAVSEFLLAEALAGREVPNYKLVEGRSIRMWKDATEVEKKLTKEGYTVDEIKTQPKLEGITAIEKLLGKNKFATVLNELVVKPAGKPTLVHVSDKRPPITKLDQAKADFKE